MSLEIEARNRIIEQVSTKLPVIPGMTPIETYDLFLLLVKLYLSAEQQSVNEARKWRSVVIDYEASNNLRLMAKELGDNEILYHMERMEKDHANDTSPRGQARWRKDRSSLGIYQTLDELCSIFFYLNPILETMSGCYRAMHKGTLDTSLLVGPHHYQTPSPSTLLHQRTVLRRKSKWSWPIVDFDPQTKTLRPILRRRGTARLTPLHPIQGYAYFHMQNGHQLSPLYRFHAHAWALREYAAALKLRGFSACPFLGDQLKVAEMLDHNDPTADPLSNKPMLRYLMEAKRLIEDRHKAYDSSNSIFLPVYFNLIDKTGKRSHTLLTCPNQFLPNAIIDMIEPDERVAAWALRPFNAKGHAQRGRMSTVGELSAIIEAEKELLHVASLPHVRPVAYTPDMATPLGEEPIQQTSFDGEESLAELKRRMLEDVTDLPPMSPKPAPKPVISEPPRTFASASEKMEHARRQAGMPPRSIITRPKATPEQLAEIASFDDEYDEHGEPLAPTPQPVPFNPYTSFDDED